MKRFVPIVVIAALASRSLCSPEQVTLTGTVVGPDDQPIQGASVAVHYWAGESIWAEATTGADGRFELSFEVDRPGDTYRVVAVKDGYAIAGQGVEPGREARIQLSDETGSITGTVTTVAAEPLQGIEVTVVVLRAPVEGLAGYVSLLDYGRAPRAETDEEGRFALAGLPRGVQARVSARGAGWARYTGQGSESWPSTGDDITISLKPEAVISGHVMREGQPVAGVRVSAQSQDRAPGAWGDAETAEDGSYRIGELSASTYNVMLVPPEGYTAVACEGVKVAAGEHATGQDLELIEGAVVEGTVTCADTGQPAVGAAIGAYGPARPTSTGWVQSGETDEQGRYELRLPPGRNRLYYMGGVEGYVHALAEPKEVWVELEAGERKTGVDFLLKPSPEFRGVVLNPDGEPAPGISVWVQGQSYTAEPREPERTDDQGRFSIRPEIYFDRPDASWLILAQDSDRDLVGLAFPEGAGRDITVQLAPGAHARADVLDLGGNPMPDIRVLVEVAHGRISGRTLPVQFVSDQNGHVEIGPIPARQQLQIRAGFEAQAMAADSAWRDLGYYSLEPGETRQLPPLKLNPAGRTLRGTVVHEQQPVAGAKVICNASLTGRPIEVTTDDLGRFELTRLKARGDVGVIAVAADGRSAWGMMCDPDLPFEPLFALEPLGVVQGVVYDAEGRPKAGARVAVFSSDLELGSGGPEELKTYDRAETDQRGRYRFEGLVPGLEYCVQAVDGAAGIHGETEPFVAPGGEEGIVLDIYMQ
jgi:hypothetical protein